jgi:signal transduction histidine kinase
MDAMKPPQRIGTALFDQMPLSIAVMDRDFNVVEANHEFVRTYGDWQKGKCYGLRYGLDRRCPHCAAVETFRDGKPRTVQREDKNHEGQVRHSMVHFAPLRGARGKIPYVIETSWDITDRVNIEKKYRLLFDHVPCYITVIDRNFRVLDANRLFRSTFSRKGARHCYEMYKGTQEACAECPATKVFKTNRAFTSLQVGVDREGNKTHYMVTAAPLALDGDTVKSVIEMAQDVSHVVNLQEQLRRMEQEKLEAERYAAVGQTVAGLAHGIKNILTGLEGGIYVVNSGLQRGDSELVASGWNMLHGNIRKISVAVKEYLDFAGGLKIRVAWANPAGIAREVMQVYNDAASQAGIALIDGVDDTVGQAPLDPQGIRTCLIHLVSNAVDACIQSDRRRKRVKVSCRQQGGAILYEVEDNGIGMDREIRRKALRSFFSTKASGQGTGLGLLITRRIVHEHGGSIRFESALGKGSRFTIELPRARLPKVGTPVRGQTKSRKGSAS